jgi:hypothetical protein
MRNVQRARRALEHAEQASDEIDRSVWLAKAADHAIEGKAVLVGGAAVNLHTGSYRPTDIDMCAYLNKEDRLMLKDLGFDHRHGDHFAYTFGDGETWLLEFPASQVDGDVTSIRLTSDEILQVISLESLIVDRVLQATDGTGVTFDEAVRLCVAVMESADWDRVKVDVLERGQLQPGLGLLETFESVLAFSQSLI